MIDYRVLFASVAVPRRAGGAAHTDVRELLKRELASRGLVVMEHRFTGRSLLHRFARVPLDGVNLIGVRPRVRVATWLVAHYDSKGQPLSMAGRLGAVGLLVLGAVGLAFRATIASAPLGVPDVALGAAGLVGLVLLAANRVTDRSAGAVDNGSGVVAALAALDAVPPSAGVGVIFPDLEEYGLLGSRALVRERPHLFSDTAVINLDGLDDRGRTMVLVHRAGPLAERIAAALGARRARWLPVIVDGSVLGRVAREAVTVVRGDWSTARTVHSPRDVASRLTLAGARDVARGVAATLLSGRVDG